MDEYRDDFFVVLPSNSNMSVYNENHSGKFTVRLPETVRLKGGWEVAATEFHYTNNFAVLPEHNEIADPKARAIPSSIFIYSDVADFQFVGDVKAQLLGIVPVSTKAEHREHWTFSPPYYSRVQSNTFCEIRVWLADQLGNELKSTTVNDFVILRLHFRRRPQQQQQQERSV